MEFREVKEGIYFFSERVKLARYINTMETSHKVSKDAKKKANIYIMPPNLGGIFLLFHSYPLSFFIFLLPLQFYPSCHLFNKKYSRKNYLSNFFLYMIEILI